MINLLESLLWSDFTETLFLLMILILAFELENLLKYKRWNKIGLGLLIPLCFAACSKLIVWGSVSDKVCNYLEIPEGNCEARANDVLKLNKEGKELKIIVKDSDLRNREYLEKNKEMIKNIYKNM